MKHSTVRHNQSLCNMKDWKKEVADLGPKGFLDIYFSLKDPAVLEFRLTKSWIKKKNKKQAKTV